MLRRVSLALALLASACAPATPAALTGPAPTAASAPHSTLAADAAACAALAQAGTPVTAGEVEASAPRLAPDRRYDVSVPGAGGFVWFSPPRPGEWSLYQSDRRLVIVRNARDEVSPLIEQDDHPHCARAAESRVHLLDGQAYTFDFAPGATTAIVLTQTHPE